MIFAEIFFIDNIYMDSAFNRIALKMVKVEKHTFFHENKLTFLTKGVMACICICILWLRKENAKFLMNPQTEPTEEKPLKIFSRFRF